MLVGTAFVVVVFLYTTFMTKEDAQASDDRITRSNAAWKRADDDIRSEIRAGFGAIEARQMEDRKLLNAILLESRKR